MIKKRTIVGISRAIIVFTLASILIQCGHMGPLTLPEQNKQAVTSSSTMQATGVTR